jgi:hypothetical protein
MADKASKFGARSIKLFWQTDLGLWGFGALGQPLQGQEVLGQEVVADSAGGSLSL